MAEALAPRTPAQNLADLLARRPPSGPHLDLHGLGLTEVPPALGDLGQMLESLDLSGNQLTRLPDGLAALPRLRVLFASGNPLAEWPGVLGDCPELSQVGLRRCSLRQVSGTALPRNLRWLTLTENHLKVLPDALGDCVHLEKLMLAGNQLDTLPDRLAGLPRLALIRLAANRLTHLPPWLAELPRLAWLAWGHNPCEAPAPAAPAAQAPGPMAWADLVLGAQLGSGASGRVQAAEWRPADGAPKQAVALKHFKGGMTSDGLPEHEMAACLAAGDHPHLPGTIGPMPERPGEPHALLMRRVPSHWQVLAGPPSAASCTRDVYPPGWRPTWAVAAQLALGVARAAAHLHSRGILHGDLYAHNVLWDGALGQAVLSDLGAASFLPSPGAGPGPGPGPSRRALEGLDVLAWGLLLEELLDACGEPVPAAARDLVAACTGPRASQRPEMAQACAQLEHLPG